MNLPNYFLADLPPEAPLSATIIEEACRTLKRNREQYLAKYSTREIVTVLAGLARDWLEPANPFRKLALEAPTAKSGFPSATLAAGLDSFFKQITADHLCAVLEQDFGNIERFDKMISI